jgi:hypothetical protein
LLVLLLSVLPGPGQPTVLSLISGFMVGLALAIIVPVWGVVVNSFRITAG